jgi:hypothetical protein
MTNRVAVTTRRLLSTCLTAILLLGLFPRAASGQG